MTIAALPPPPSNNSDLPVAALPQLDRIARNETVGPVVANRQHRAGEKRFNTITAKVNELVAGAVLTDGTVPMTGDFNLNGHRIVNTGAARVDAYMTGTLAVTLDTTDLIFSHELIDTANAWNGTTFTAPRSKFYEINACAGIIATSAIYSSIGIWINGTFFRYGPSCIMVLVNPPVGLGISMSVFLNAGDVLSLRSSVSGTQTDATNGLNWITIEELA